MVYPVYFVRAYPPLHGIAETQKKNLNRKLGNYGKIMQRKVCMACMEPYVAFGYGCQERSTRAALSLHKFQLNSYIALGISATHVYIAII